MLWCSWQPHNLKCCVKTNHIATVRVFRDWLPRSPLDHIAQWLVPLMHRDICHSPAHGGSERCLWVLCDCWQTLCPWQWKCWALPASSYDCQVMLSLPANCLACNVNHPSFSPRWKTSVSFAAYNIWTISFFFSPCGPNSKPRLSAFLCVRVFCIFLKLLQFFHVIIGNSTCHCLKIRNNNFSVTIETGCNFYM